MTQLLPPCRAGQQGPGPQGGHLSWWSRPPPGDALARPPVCGKGSPLCPDEARGPMAEAAVDSCLATAAGLGGRKSPLPHPPSALTLPTQETASLGSSDPQEELARLLGGGIARASWGAPLFHGGWHPKVRPGDTHSPVPKAGGGEELPPSAPHLQGQRISCQAGSLEGGKSVPVEPADCPQEPPHQALLKTLPRTSRAPALGPRPPGRGPPSIVQDQSLVFLEPLVPTTTTRSLHPSPGGLRTQNSPLSRLLLPNTFLVHGD